MSVILFPSSEFADIASVLAPGASDADKHKRRKFCEALAIVSEANSKAFHASYNGDASDHSKVTSDELMRLTIDYHLSRGASRFKERAKSTLMLLHYNTIANDGTEYATSDTLMALLTLNEAWVRRFG
jgi:hypothetical protein